MKPILRVSPFILIIIFCLVIHPASIRADANPWEDLGGGINIYGSHVQSSMAIAADGTAYVAWNNNTGDFHVHHFNGTTWDDISETLNSGPGDCKLTRFNNDVYIAIGSDEIPYIAWHNGDNGTANWDIYACRYNGTYWEQVGSGSATGDGLSNDPYTAHFPDIAVDNLNRPYVVWANSTNGTETSGIHVRRFNGTIWEEVGSGSASDGGISQGQGSDPKIAIDSNGTPYIAWVSYFGSISVRRFNGTIWEEVGEGSASFPYGMSHTTAADYPKIGIGPGGEPYIVWQEWVRDTGPYNWEIMIRRFNGTEWEEVGEGSGTGGGITNTGYTNSIFPSLAFAGDGTPYVTWTEDTSQFTDGIHQSLWVRRFNGISWEEVYPGSASYAGEGVDEGVRGDEPGNLTSNQVGRAYAAYSKETQSGKQLRVQELQYSLDAAAPVQELYRVPNPVLTWSSVTWSQGYAIEVDDARDFLTPLYTDYALTSTQLAYTVPDLRSGTYYWRISARDGSNPPTKWSPANRFVILLP